MNPNPDYITTLKEIYPGIPDEIANNVIQIAQENNPDGTYEANLDIMLNLLSGYEGALNTPAVNDELLHEYYQILMQMFPDANPDFMLQFCRNQLPDFNLDDAVQKIITGNFVQFFFLSKLSICLDYWIFRRTLYIIYSALETVCIM